MGTLSFDPQGMLAKLEAGDSASLARDILSTLEYFENEVIGEEGEQLLPHINIITKIILQSLLSENFTIPQKLEASFVRQNTTLANMVRLSNFRNADMLMKAMLEKPAQLAKLLLIYSPYCTVRLNVEELFKVQPYLTSLWVATVLKGRWKGTEETHRFIAELIEQPALEHYTLDDQNFPLMEDTYFAYFDSTYASDLHDRRLRDIINRKVQAQFKLPFTPPAKNMKRILVISANMSVQHAVYRCLAPLLQSLKPDYHLALYDINLKDSDLDTALFDEVKSFKGDNFTYDMLKEILAGDYGIVLFTDIGLNRPSVILSNLRLAPIQITTYGHPVTSGKSKIDYYIGGMAVEEKENPQRHFVEKLILIPGLGVEPVPLNYQPRFPASTNDWVEVGISWGEMKFMYPHLLLLKEIQQKSNKPIRYHFIGINATRLSYLAIREDLQEMFGKEQIKVSAMMQNPEYLEALEACDLLIDSYHFGSYNRIVDCLTCAKPVVSLEGKKSYNRFAAALLRQVGMPELIASTPAAFVEKTLKLIEDKSWRNQTVEKLRKLDLKTKLFETDNARYFKDAIDGIVAKSGI